MTTQNNLREISKILYQLKKDFGLPMSVRIFDPLTFVVDHRTGRETVDYTDYPIKRGILLPIDWSRKFHYDLSYIAANKNFTYGGFSDEGLRTIIIARKDLPSTVDVNMDDQLAFDNRKYTIRNIAMTEKEKGYLFTVKQLTSEADLP
jgi:hypothetical protein